MGHRDLGSGKSTVRRCLAERGVRAHVVDGDEFREWREKETNEPIVEPSNWHEPDRVDGPEDARVPMSSELRDVQRRLSPSEVAALIAVYEAVTGSAAGQALWIDRTTVSAHGARTRRRAARPILFAGAGGLHC
jgi:hypothetical protein